MMRDSVLGAPLDPIRPARFLTLFPDPTRTVQFKQPLEPARGSGRDPCAALLSIIKQ